MSRIVLPQGEEKTRRVQLMFDTIAPRYEFVNKLMTLGMDRRWRRHIIRDLYLPPESRVLDIATGTGDLYRESLRQGLLPIGTDLSFGMLAVGQHLNISVQSDAAHLPFLSGSFDGVTCGYALRNFTELQLSLNEMARVLRPGGRLSIIEVSEPKNVVLRFGFRIWFRGLVPIIGAIVSDRGAYQYLPKSTAYLPPTEVLRSMFNVAGFSAVNHHSILGGLSQRFTATRST